MSTERSPRMAVQNTEWHRHFRLDGRGYSEHAHAIGRRVHEHLATRLGRVVLSWADRTSGDRPLYEQTPLVIPDEVLLFTVAVMLAVLIAAAFLMRAG